MPIAFRTWMIEHKITQKDIATATGLTESSVSRKMRNFRNWKAPEISKIMKHFQLTPDQVVQFFLSVEFEK